MPYGLEAEPEVQSADKLKISLGKTKGGINSILIIFGHRSSQINTDFFI
jgi:hypothetical protein